MSLTAQRIPPATSVNQWGPIEGPFTRDFIERKLLQRGAPDAEAMTKIVSEAAQILGKCASPTVVRASEAGLVIGYVQSGKTLSFTTVAALARDNGFGAVILLAGTAANLKGQSEKRLIIDLGLEDTQHDWRHFENPDPAKNDHAEIEKVLRNWRKTASSGVGSRKRSLLITVLKQHQRLQNLVDALRKLDLTGVPFLVIDDESDQASLNTKASKNRKDGTNDRSTTYDRILQLKSVIPHHTYLQYTATPQANLLIGIADVLSPSFAELVSPGEGYVGGQHFFNSETPSCFEIPTNEVPTDDNPLAEAPQTLQEALRLYLLGAAHHNKTRGKGNRSMMIHPSQKTAPHADYKAWIYGLIEQWREFIEEPKQSRVRVEIEAEFKKDYDSLKRTFPALEPFDELMEVLPDVISDLKIAKVNSNADGEREVKWNNWPYWILVGGQKLDRGFTVEGLTVTYMPRTASSNADTLQQRARFFGYKKAYEGLCRVFLLGDVMEAFQEYVKSEEFVRSALVAHKGKPLQDWKRDFILHRALNPTRPNVVGRRIEKVEMDGGWIVPKTLYKDINAVLSNKILFETKAAQWKLKHGSCDASMRPEFKDERKDSPRNILIENVPVDEVLDFLLNVQIRNIEDSTDIAATALSLVKHRKDTARLVDVILMGDLKTDGLTGRSLTADGKINNLFVGESPKGAKSRDDLNYVGDRAIFSRDRVTLHLRFLKLKENPNVDPKIADCVPWFSIRLSSDVAEDCVIEEG